MSTTYKVAIIGAGPAGCTLAHLLLKHNISVTVFEGESSSQERTQGGSLDLHTETGIAAIKACGLFAEFQKYARYDGEAMALADKRNKRYISFGGATDEKTSKGRPEIDRAKLRTLLSETLPNGVIKWGHHLKSVSEDGTLHFSNGDVKGFDLIVGADGAWSKVRRVLTDEKPSYAGISGFVMKITDAERRRPWVHKLANRGTWFSYGDHKSIICQQLGDGSLTVAFWRKCSEDFANDYNVDDPAAVREAMHQEHASWAAEYHAVIDAVDPDYLDYRGLYHLPIGYTWTSKPGFTVIGDAAHLMTPFAGEGVNCAMADAMHLADAIQRAQIEDTQRGDGAHDALHTKIAAFEAAMIRRLTPIQQTTLANMNDMYGQPDGPRPVIERYIVRNVCDDAGWYVRLPVTAAVRAVYLVVKWWLA